jgi:adenylosuccinate synthase
LAKHEIRLSKYVQPVVPFMRDRLTIGERIIIEGTQGFGLSLLHSTDYPYVTSRDTTAAAFVAEAGLSPLDVDDVVLVLRAFPIRVAGNSGSLPYEIDWNTLSEEARSILPIVEHTSVTQVVRRVARFHPDVVRQAITANNPTRIVLNHIDYIDSACKNLDSLTKETCNFIKNIEILIDAPITYLGFGPSSLASSRQVKDKIHLYD